MKNIEEGKKKYEHDTLHHLSNLCQAAKEFVKKVDEISLKMIIGKQEAESLKDIEKKIKILKGGD